MKTKVGKLLLACMAANLLQLALATQQPNATNSVFNALKSGRGDGFALVFALYFGCTVGVFLLTVLSDILQMRLSTRIAAEQEGNLIAKVLHSGSKYHKSIEPEAVVERISRDTEMLVGFRLKFLTTVPFAVVGLAANLVMMFFGSGPVLKLATLVFPRAAEFAPELFASPQKGNTLLALVVIATSLLYLFFLFFNQKFQDLESSVRQASENEKFVQTETLRGVVDIRSSNSFGFAMSRVLRAIARLVAAQLRFFSIIAVFQSISGMVWHVTEAVVLGVSALLIFNAGKSLGLDGSGSFGLGDYMAFVALFQGFNLYMRQIIDVFREWMETRPARHRIGEIDGQPRPFSDDAGKVPPANGSGFSIRGLGFKTEDGREILRGIDIDVRSGEHVALVGPSGCGKSTLLKLVMRHLEPSSGEILFSGFPIEEWNFGAYASCVAYVSQHPFIFDGTIRENIVVGRDVDDAAIEEAARDVALYADLLQKNPDISKALDYHVKAGGEGVSGGQTAKIALARALVGNPRALLLDEVTASLDQLSQDHVAKMLSEKCRDKTIVSISHRLPAVKGMDRVVVLESGGIVQDGTYAGLLHSPGLFAVLAARESGWEVAPSRGGESVVSGAGSPGGLVQVLSLSPVFMSLDAWAIAKLAAGASRCRLGAGEFLFHKGDAGGELYVVVSGLVEINGVQYGSGFSFGEIGLFAESVRTADVVALTDVELVSLGRDTIVSVGRAYPGVLLEILKGVSGIAARQAGFIRKEDEK